MKKLPFVLVFEIQIVLDKLCHGREEVLLRVGELVKKQSLLEAFLFLFFI